MITFCQSLNAVWVVKYTNRWWDIQTLTAIIELISTRQRSWGEGDVLTGVYLSTEGGAGYPDPKSFLGVSLVPGSFWGHLLGPTPDMDQRGAGWQTGTGWQTGGMHPTGMHNCLNFFSLRGSGVAKTLLLCPCTLALSCPTSHLVEFPLSNI